MAAVGEIHVKVTGVGKSRVGLWLLGVVAKVFLIDLDVKLVGDDKLKGE